MDTLSAFALGEANRGKEEKVFDWDLVSAYHDDGLSDYLGQIFMEAGCQ